MPKFHYIHEVPSFTFTQIPLFLNSAPYNELSLEAVILYSAMLDRAENSKLNNKIDSKKGIYIYFTIEEIEKTCRCKKRKASTVKKELESFGLIENEKGKVKEASKIFIKVPELPSTYYTRDAKFARRENVDISATSASGQTTKPDNKPSARDAKFARRENAGISTTSQSAKSQSVDNTGFSRDAKNARRENVDVSGTSQLSKVKNGVVEPSARGAKFAHNLYIYLSNLDDDDYIPKIKDSLKKYLLTDNFVTNTTDMRFLEIRLRKLIRKIENSNLNKIGLQKKMDYLSSQEVKSDTLNFWIKTFDTMTTTEVKQLNGETKPHTKSQQKNKKKKVTTGVDWDNYHPESEKDTPNLTEKQIKDIFREYGKKND